MVVVVAAGLDGEADGDGIVLSVVVVVVLDDTTEKVLVVVVVAAIVVSGANLAGGSDYRCEIGGGAVLVAASYDASNGTVTCPQSN